MSESETVDDESEYDIDEEWIEDTFAERVEAEDSVTMDEVKEWYRQKLDEYDGNTKLTRITVQSEFNSLVNVGGDGNVQMITIGGQEDPFNNGNVFIGYALCIPEDGQVKLGTILFDRDTIDPDPYKEYFYEPFSPVEGEFDISDAQPPVGNNAYRLNAVETTEVSRFEPEKNRDERREMVNDFVPGAAIADVGKSLSLTNDNGFAASFGVDMRVVEDAYVHEARVNNSARLVVQDESFIDARDLGDEIRGEDGDAGLVCYGDPELVDFGDGSIVNLYGSITPGPDGQITMSLYGVDPVNTTERDDGGSSGGSSSSSAQEDSATSGGSTGISGADEERTI